MTTITSGATTITPDLVLGYTVETVARNVVHSIIGRADPDVSLADDSLRRGALELFFAARADAWEAQALHRSPAVFALTDPDVPEVNMTYVRDGAMTITLDPDTRELWLLKVGFQEVAP